MLRVRPRPETRVPTTCDLHPPCLGTSCCASGWPPSLGIPAQSYCLSVQFYQWGECAAPGDPIPAFEPSTCQGWGFYREGASPGWNPRAGAVWNKPAFQASPELSPFPLRPKAIVVRGSGAWPEARALTLTPTGPGFACCESAIVSTGQSSALRPQLQESSISDTSLPICSKMSPGG